MSTPAIGYLLKTYPKLSETFILNEIAELEKSGMPLHLFSLRMPAFGDKVHDAVTGVQAKVTYVRRWLRLTGFGGFLAAGVNADPLDATFLVVEHAKLFARNPVRYISTLWFYVRLPDRKRLRDFLQAGALARALHVRKIRHLHAHFANVPTSVAELVRGFSGISFSFTAHAKDIYLTDRRELSRKMRAAAFVVTCTGYNREYLEAIGAGGSPIHLAYHGIDLSRFRAVRTAPRPENPPRLLSVGRFCEKKGFSYLIKACRALKDRGCAFSCAIVGWGPMRDQMERQIAELDLANEVALLPGMTQDRLVDMYGRASVFVLPCILTDDGDRDGIPNVLIEAMAMRVPVVSTYVSGIPELVDHMNNGLLVPEKNEAALADALELLLSRPELRARFGENGREKVASQFTLERNVGQIRELLLTAAGAGNHGLQRGETLAGAVQ